MKKVAKKKLVLFITICVVVLALFFGVTTVYVNTISSALTKESSRNLITSTTQGSNQVSYSIETDLLGLKMLSSNFAVVGVFTDVEMVAQLNQLVESGSFLSVAVCGVDGFGITNKGDNIDFSKSEGFAAAIRGQSFMSCKPEMGTTIPRLIYDVPIFSKSGRVEGVVSGVKDVSSLAAVLDISAENGATAYIVNRDGDFIARATSSDISPEKNSVFDFITPLKNSQKTIAAFKKGLSGTDTFIGPINSRGIDKFFTCTPITNNADDWFYMTVIPQDIVHTQVSYFVKLTAWLLVIFLSGLLVILGFIFHSRNKHTKEITALAHIDQLTGISNWNKFRLDCDDIIEASTKQRRAIISIDIDGFKVFNDIYGHSEGNKVLRGIAKELERFTMLGERCSRYSADTFLALVKFSDDNNIINWITSFKEAVTNMFTSYPLTLCFGVYKINGPGYPLDIMCDRANLARRTIKGNHENFYAFYHDETRRHIIEVKEIENDMNIALETNQYLVYFQPKHRFSDNKIVGAEALVRWSHPTKGMIFPDSFIPVFERNGFLIHLDMYVLEETCRVIRSWIDTGIEPIPISVNMSQIHLKDPAFVYKLITITEAHNIPPKHIEIELTESAIFENMESFTRTVSALKSHGFTVSMDDFGSGYSSLNLLSELQVDVLKIDRKFLSKSSDTIRGKYIIESVINMAKNLGIKTVSEGVETAEQVEFLKKAGCDIAQGYFYSRALSLESFENYLAQSN